MAADPNQIGSYEIDHDAIMHMFDEEEEQEKQEMAKMSEGYHGFDGIGRGGHFGGAAQGEATWQTSGPASPTINDITVNVEGVRDIRRIIDELRVYADKLTTDVKVPRKELKDFIDRLSKTVGGK